jgi:hypothetical protein
MSKLVSNYDGGTTDQYGTFLAFNRFLTGDVIEGLAVTAQASPNMTVLVGTGSGRISTGTYPTSYGFFIAVDTTGGESVTIGTAAASPRIDYIVAYIDIGVSGSLLPINVNNKNNVLKFADVQGTPAGSPVVPTVSQIQTAIGAANPYIILAQIAVAASATQITNPNITDLRSMAGVQTANIAAGAVTNAKLSTTAGELGGAMTSWSPTVVGFSSTTVAQYYWMKFGKLVFFMIQVSGTSNSTSFTITLPTASAAHITNIEGVVALALNNSSVVTATPRWEINPGTSATLMNLYSGVTGTGWTASGTKSAQFSGFYEAA